MNFFQMWKELEFSAKRLIQHRHLLIAKIRFLQDQDVPLRRLVRGVVQEIVDVQLVVPGPVIIASLPLVPEDAPVLAGGEDKGGLIQAVLAAQGGGRIMKILVVPPAEGRSAAMPVVEKGDGDPLRGGAEEEVGQAQLLHPGEGLELAALHEAQAVREGVLDLSRGEAKPGQGALQPLAQHLGRVQKALPLLVKPDPVDGGGALGRDILERIGHGELPPDLGAPPAPLLLVPGEVDPLDYQHSDPCFPAVIGKRIPHLRKFLKQHLPNGGRFHIIGESFVREENSMTLDRTYFEEMEAKIPRGRVRTRFAPSPTGYMHVGNLRTALYTWLIARNAGGTFILRIEDTDQGRKVEGATEVIYRTLAECRLDHDEGPDVGGPVAPYIQSERRDTYGKYARLLVERGHAYYCFCEKTEEGEEGGFERGEDPCRALPLEEAQARVDAGEPYVIRQKIPREGNTTFHDAIFGDITVENKTLDDQVLIKRDGMPTYNFANVIDDHLMGITHVVRGSEYLSSAPKYNLLYEGFGWEVPTYVHCSPVMRDAQNKMSKRHGDPSYEDLKDQGFLTEAILNYVALLGWSPRGEIAEQEVFSLEELAKVFDLAGMSKSPAIFDLEKLTHFNALYLRAMSPEAFAKAAEPYIRSAVKDENLSASEIAALLQARCERLTDIPEKVEFFQNLPEYSPELFTNKKSKTNPEVSKAMLEAAVPMLEGLDSWSQDAIHDGLVALAERLEVKNATLMWPVRIAAAGQAVTPGGAVEICRILGKEETLRRLKLGLEKLK